jgi:ubiquinone/menaquinone biosynthesis C-methylase UbiE
MSSQARHARERTHHDRLAERLDPAAMPPAPPDEWEQALLDGAGDVAGLRVLELGCGDGGLSLALLERGAELTAIDISPAMVALAEARAARFAPGAAARFVVTEAEATGLDAGAFDLVVGKWVLHHVDLARAADEIARVLRPGGRGVFADSSSLNPALALARGHLVGRLGVARFGTPDERPLGRADFELLAPRFARVRVDFPNFWLVQMLDRHLTRGRWPAVTRLCQRADAALGRTRLRPYGYWLRVEVFK